MNASQARKRLRAIAKERLLHEQALLAERGPLVAGSLISRTTQCMRPGCRCTKGHPHGPFLYLSRRAQGRTQMRYLGKASPGRVANAARRYKAFAEHKRALRRLAREADACMAALEKALLRDPDELKKHSQ